MTAERYEPGNTDRYRAEREEVLRHTQLASTPLAPEIHLRLLREDSSLWWAFGDDANAAIPSEGDRNDPPPNGRPRPYWAFAWAGGQAMARYVLDHRELATGKRVLDFGAGCGIAAIAAAQVGAAKVTAADVDPTAIAAIGLNAQLNHVHVSTVCEDLIYSESHPWDVVLAGDVWYDTRLARHGFRWLQTLVGSGILVLTADPGRHYSPSRDLQHLAQYRARSVPDLEHPNLQDVRVYRLLPRASEGESD